MRSLSLVIIAGPPWTSMPTTLLNNVSFTYYNSILDPLPEGAEQEQLLCDSTAEKEVCQPGSPLTIGNGLKTHLFQEYLFWPNPKNIWLTLTIPYMLVPLPK